jgi:hypothetical protein
MSRVAPPGDEDAEGADLGHQEQQEGAHAAAQAGTVVVPAPFLLERGAGEAVHTVHTVAHTRSTKPA